MTFPVSARSPLEIAVPGRSARRLLATSTALGVLLLASAPDVDAASLVGWGNGRGLGIATSAPTFTPASVPVENVETVAVGLDRSFLLTPRGVYATGYPNGGSYIPALGLGLLASVTEATTPTLIPDTTDVTAAASGEYATFLLRGDGTVSGFGYNGLGTAGGTIVSSSTLQPATPANKVPGPGGTPLSNIVAISSGQAHGLALDRDGAVWAWGRAAQLGNPAQTTNTGTAVKVELPSGVRVAQISAGRTHSLVLTEDGDVYSWGANASGQLGLGDTTTRSTPTKIAALSGLPGGSRVTSVSAGLGTGSSRSTSFALLSDGTFRAWGSNLSGELGLALGATDDVTVPTARNPLAPPASYPAFVELSAAGSGAFARTADGRVFAWGTNAKGALGSVFYDQPFPFGALPSNDQGATEVPQRVGKLIQVSELAVGGFGQHQLVLTEPTLRESPNARSERFFFSQQVGTISKHHAITATSIGAPSVVSRIRITGPDASDFFFVNTRDAGTIDAVQLPLTVQAGESKALLVRFAPSAEGVRNASVVWEADGETLTIPIEGFGTPLTGGPVGDSGKDGKDGKDGVSVVGPEGKAGKDGVVSVAATRGVVTVRRGRTARLPFVVLNGTGTTVAKASARATTPGALRATGIKPVSVSALGSGQSRRFSVPVKVGKAARIGTHRVTITTKIAGKTIARTVRVRVKR